MTAKVWDKVKKFALLRIQTQLNSLEISNDKNVFELSM